MPPAPSVPDAPDATMAEPVAAGESAASSAPNAAESIKNMLIGGFPIRQTYWGNQPIFSAIDVIEKAMERVDKNPSKTFQRTIANVANAGGNLDNFTHHIEVRGNKIYTNTLF
jgi:hypothetical protein